MSNFPIFASILETLCKEEKDNNNIDVEETIHSISNSSQSTYCV